MRGEHAPADQHVEHLERLVRFHAAAQLSTRDAVHVVGADVPETPAEALEIRDELVLHGAVAAHHDHADLQHAVVVGREPRGLGVDHGKSHVANGGLRCRARRSHSTGPISRKIAAPSRAAVRGPRMRDRCSMSRGFSRTRRATNESLSTASGIV